MNINQYIAGAAPDAWSIEKHSMEEGTLSFSWRVRAGEQDTHTEEVGATASGEGYSYTLEHVGRAYHAGGGYSVGQSWSDGLGALNEIPCFMRKNLPAAARARTLAATRWGLTALVSCEDILAACASAAANAGITIDFSGVHAGDVLVPLIDNGSTIGSVLSELARHVPNMTTRVVGNTVTVCGGEGALTSVATHAKGVIECSPDMKCGTLTVGSTVVDLAAVYAANAASVEPLNWYSNCARLICDALAGCEEADAMCAGKYIFLTARVAGAAGNSIALTLSGVSEDGTAARAVVTPGADLDAAGSLTDGVNSVELEALGTPASVSVKLEYLDGTMWPEFGISATGRSGYVVETFWDKGLTADNVQEYVDFLNGATPGSLQGVARASWEVVYDDEIWMTLEAAGDWAGAAGNALLLNAFAPSPFSGDHSFQGGVDGGRTLGDLVDAINGEDDFPFTAAAGCVAASGTATVAERTKYTGCAVVVMRGGVTLATATVGASGLNSLAAFVDALNGKGALTAHVTFSANGQVLTATAAAAGAAGNGVELMLRWLSPPIKTYTITLAGGEDGSGIVLTADEAGSDGNGIGVQAAGCFGVAGQFSGGTDAAGYDYGVTPFSGGGGQDIRAAYDGLLGQRSQQALPSGWRITSHRVDYDKGNEPPPCVVGVTSVGGMQSVAFVVPEGANPQQRGALVLDVDCARTVTPQVEKESWEYDTEKAKELARQEVRNAVRAANSQTEKTAPWMLVKGAAIPAGWDIASGNVKMNEPHAKDADKWQRFWAQFGVFKTLKKISSGIGFGKPYFFPVAAEDAYPPEQAAAFAEDKSRLGKPLAPAVQETSNVPANYKVLGPRDNMHYLVEGSFPASSKAGANVSGLKFCKGCLKQYVFISDKVKGITAQEALDFFPGSYKYTVKNKKGRDKERTCRFTCLKLEGVFINRAKKRYQVGTNRQSPSDPDYNEDKDGGAGWYILGDRTEEDPEPVQGLTRTDYIEAARAYLAACGNAGTAGRTEEITAHVLGGEFDAGMSVDDVFSALSMAPAASGGYSYNSETREVTARGSAGQYASLELEDFLTRRRAVKESAWLNWKERHKDAEEQEPRERRDDAEEPPAYPLTPQERQEEREKESYPQVSGGVNATSGVSSESKPLNPFQVYAEGDQWFINEGEMASPKYGVLKFPTTNITQHWAENRSFYVKVVPAVGGGWTLAVKWHEREEEEEEED